MKKFLVILLKKFKIQNSLLVFTLLFNLTVNTLAPLENKANKKKHKIANKNLDDLVCEKSFILEYINKIDQENLQKCLILNSYYLEESFFYNKITSNFIQKKNKKKQSIFIFFIITHLFTILENTRADSKNTSENFISSTTFVKLVDNYISFIFKNVNITFIIQHFEKLNVIIQKLTLNNQVYPLLSFIVYPQKKIRDLCNKTLHILGDDRYIPIVFELYNSSRMVENVYALESMKIIKDKRFKEHVIKYLSHENQVVRYFAISAFTSYLTSANIAHLHRVALKDDYYVNRHLVAHLLGKYKIKHSFNTLGKLVLDINTRVRKEALQAILKYKSSKASYFIAKQLKKEQSSQLQLLQIQALIELNHISDYRAIETVLKNSNDEEVLKWALYLAGLLKTRHLAKSITKFLKHKAKNLRLEAANALMALKYKFALSDLLDRITDATEKYQVRITCLYATLNIIRNKDLYVIYDLIEREKNLYFKIQLKDFLKIKLKEI